MNSLLLRAFLLRHTVLAAVLVAAAPGLRADVMLENLTNSAVGDANVTFGAWWGARFLSGDDPAGYTLDSVTLSFGAVANSSGNFFVGIYSDASTLPGSQVGGNLSGPANPPASGNSTYTASGITLDASTIYWLVAGVSTGSGSYNLRVTNLDTFTAQENWALFPTNSLTNSSNQGSSWNAPLSSAQEKFSISATPVPEPGHYAALFAAGALGLVLWRRKRARA